jgi:ABC-2 type transport system permease protein
MIKNIFILTLNDLAIATKNKTIFLILFIPLFVFFILKMVDTKNQDSIKINLGLIKEERYSPILLKSILNSEKIFNNIYIDSKEFGEKLLKDKKLDGLLLKSGELIVLKQGSSRTLSIIENFNFLQLSAEGKKAWITNIVSLQETNLQKESLPTWILMLVLLVGFFIMPVQIAEEKEKKLLLSLLQTPMREIEWLLAKVITGMILTSITLFMLHMFADFKVGINLSYIIMVLLGSFCFSSYGVLIGFVCSNQASARILGVVFYLPHLLPSALSDFSKKLDFLAPILPSYQFYESIKRILFEGIKISSLGAASTFLLLVGTATFLISYFLMKKRWMM